MTCYFGFLERKNRRQRSTLFSDGCHLWRNKNKIIYNNIEDKNNGSNLKSRNSKCVWGRIRINHTVGVGSMVSKFYFVVNWSLLELFAKKKLLFCLITELSWQKFYDRKKLHCPNITQQMINISENLLLICVSQFRWRGLLIAATYFKNGLLYFFIDTYLNSS